MTTTPAIARKATIEDLYHVEGKAEIVNGKIITFMPTGGLPGYAGDEIYTSLRAYAKRTGAGMAVGDGKGFHVMLPNRESFSPDAAYHVGEMPTMRFYEGAPVFAVEVHSEGDYGEAAEREMAQKRDDYFAAGTKVVWDVDLKSENVIRKYRAEALKQPEVFQRGEVADAEPAVPGWIMPVDDLFV